MRQIRKLAAILSADVFGYSRLMSEDEQGTVAGLHDSKEVMARLIDAVAASICRVVLCGLRLTTARLQIGLC